MPHRHSQELRGVHGVVDLIKYLRVCVGEVVNCLVLVGQLVHGLVQGQGHAPDGVVGQGRLLGRLG